MSSDILIAKESFTTTIKGQLYPVVKGTTRIASDHPLAKQNPEYFEPLSAHVSFGVESATKKPGKQRGNKGE